MVDDQGLASFAEQMRAEVIARATGDDSGGIANFKENIFTSLVAEYLVEAGAIDDAEVCYFSRKHSKGSLKANAFHYDEETKQLDLFVSLYKNSERISRLRKNDVIKSVDQIIRFYKAAIGGLHQEMEPAHDDFSMVERLFATKLNTERVRCYFLTDALSPVSSLASRSIDGIPIRIEIWDVERLYRASLAHSPHESVTVDFIGRFGKPLRCLDLERSTGEYSAYVAIVPGPVLSNLYDEFGSKLLELNVRSFLQSRGKVNRAIRDTLKHAPERFLAYNNGISATAESIELVDDGGTPAIKMIRDLQIVNGGQTTASIHRAEKEDKIDLSRVFVQAKIIVVDPSKVAEFVPLISRYANSQNAVREADFSANDSFHIEIERLSEATWCPGEQSRWFYERARGQYQVAKSREATTVARRRQFEKRCPPSQKFTKTDLAKFINSWDQQPCIVSRGSQKNFIEFMLRLKSRGSEWRPDVGFFKELVAKAILCKQAEKIARQVRIPAYVANVVTYTVAYLSFRAAGRLDLQQFWNSQSVSESVVEALRSWVKPIYEELVSSARGRNVTEWAKKEECWRHIRAMSLSLPSSLNMALANMQPTPNVGLRGKSGAASLTANEKEKMARVMQVQASVWFEISDWGRRTGKLKAWQAGIAHTLCGYASDGWQHVPSAKQTNQAIRILEIASIEFDVFS